MFEKRQKYIFLHRRSCTNTPISHNIETTCLILCRHGLRCLKVSSGMWNQDVSSIFFKSCKLLGGETMDWTMVWPCAISFPAKHCTRQSSWYERKCDLSDQATFFLGPWPSSDAHMLSESTLSGWQWSAWAWVCSDACQSCPTLLFCYSSATVGLYHIGYLWHPTQLIPFLDHFWFLVTNEYQEHYTKPAILEFSDPVI